MWALGVSPAGKERVKFHRLQLCNINKLDPENRSIELSSDEPAE
jgi:hypothetical protein